MTAKASIIDITGKCKDVTDMIIKNILQTAIIDTTCL